MTETRDHFVYTAYNSDGRVLYVGCTKNLDKRMAAHRSQSDWYKLAVRFHLRGPYDYKVGRDVERERLLIERPLYGFHPKRRTYAAIYSRILNREHGSRIVDPGDQDQFWSTFKEAREVANELVPGGHNNRAPLDVTDDVLRQAFRAEQMHAESLERLRAGAA